MERGILLRTMGPASQPETLLACARAAEAAGLDALWVPDHVAIPPEDAEGSNGRYLDPLATLAFLAAHTTTIGLGTAVLILPYRSALPTLKAVATVQELSAGRLRLGVGVGWMGAEFRALGVPRERRGALADAALDLLGRCFEGDVVEENGQRFLFRPRPARPPVLVGGAAPHALERTVRHGDAWMPMAADPEALRRPVQSLRALAVAAGRETPGVVVMTALPLSNERAAGDRLAAFAAVGATGLLHAQRYTDAEGFAAICDTLAALPSPS